MTQTTAPAPAPTHRTEVQLTLEVATGDAALMRIFAMLHHRQCRVLGMIYVGERLDLRVQAPGRHASRVALWLDSLVEVRSRSVLILVRPGAPMAADPGEIGEIAGP